MARQSTAAWSSEKRAITGLELHIAPTVEELEQQEKAEQKRKLGRQSAAGTSSANDAVVHIESTADELRTLLEELGRSLAHWFVHSGHQN